MSYNITYLYICVIQWVIIHYIPVHMCHTTLHVSYSGLSYNITYLYICVIQHYILVHMCHTTLHTCTCVIQHYIPVHMCHTVGYHTLHTCTYVSYNITYLYICVIQHYIPVHMCHTTLHTCTYVSYSGLSNPEVSKVGCCEFSSGCGISSKSIGFSF